MNMKEAVDAFKTSDEFSDICDKMKKDTIEACISADEFLDKRERIMIEAIEAFKYSDEFLVICERMRNHAIEAFKSSDEFLDRHDKFRKDAIKVYKSSDVFLTAVQEKAVTFYRNGFETCRLQFLKSSKLPKGFNFDFLDVLADEWGNYPGLLDDRTTCAVSRTPNALKAEV